MHAQIRYQLPALSGDKDRWGTAAARVLQSSFKGGTVCVSAYRAYLYEFLRRCSVGFCGVSGQHVVVGIRGC